MEFWEDTDPEWLTTHIKHDFRSYNWAMRISVTLHLYPVAKAGIMMVAGTSITFNQFKSKKHVFRALAVSALLSH